MNEATTARTVGTSTLLVSGIMFGISVLVTLAFGYALIADPSRLTEAWLWTRTLPLVIQIVLWLIFLPWMAALWVWNMPLDAWMRALIVVGILAVAEYLLFPWKG